MEVDMDVCGDDAVFSTVSMLSEFEFYASPRLVSRLAQFTDQDGSAFLSHQYGLLQPVFLSDHRCSYLMLIVGEGAYT